MYKNRGLTSFPIRLGKTDIFLDICTTQIYIVILNYYQIICKKITFISPSFQKAPR